MKAPTNEQIATHSRVDLDDGRVAVACWYPQMGGYVGRCWIQFWPGDSNTCFDVLVYHDGEFPFGGDASPAELHHCDPEQFIRFGEFVKKEQADK